MRHGETLLHCEETRFYRIEMVRTEIPLSKEAPEPYLGVTIRIMEPPDRWRPRWIHMTDSERAAALFYESELRRLHRKYDLRVKGEDREQW